MSTYLNKINEIGIKKVIINKLDMKSYKIIFTQAEKLFLSHEVKLRKENDSAYKYILARIPFSPLEIIFIDNKSEYIEKSKQFGINGILYTSEIDLEKELLSIDQQIFN